MTRKAFSPFMWRMQIQGRSPPQRLSMRLSCPTGRSLRETAAEPMDTEGDGEAAGLPSSRGQDHNWWVSTPREAVRGPPEAAAISPQGYLLRAPLLTT